MNALSSAVVAVIALPCVAVILALALDSPARAPGLAPLRLLPIVALLCATVAAIGIRAARPYAFAGWHEPPIGRATELSDLPELRGMRLSRETIETTSRISRLILAATGPGEALFTFPVYPIFNWLTCRPVPTFAILHWIDVTPDRVVVADLERVLADPPPAVVFQRRDPRLLKINEVYFRAGRESGMRRMEVEVGEMLERDYVVAFRARIPLREQLPPLELWIRGDRAEAAGIEPVGKRRERSRR